MLKRKFKVTVKPGIHARPATDLVRKAEKYKSEVKVTANEQTIDMKSIMGLMSLGMYQGQEFTLIIQGEDETTAMTELTNHFLENGLAKVNE